MSHSSQMAGPDRVWRWSPRDDGWYYTLGYYRSTRRWEFSGRGYGTSGWRTPVGAFVGWLRFYREARHYRQARRSQGDL